MADHRGWEAIESAVRRVIDEGGVGRPAVVRCTFTSSAGSDRIDRQLDALRGVASRWFGGDPADEYRVGAEDRGHMVAALRWAGGESAILTAGIAGGDDRIGGTLIVLGSRGALYYDIPEPVGGGT